MRVTWRLRRWVRPRIGVSGAWMQVRDWSFARQSLSLRDELHSRHSVATTVDPASREADPRCRGFPDLWVPALIFSGGLTHPMFILLAWLIIFQAREDRRERAYRRHD